MKYNILFVFIFVFTLACSEDQETGDIKKSDFNTPEEYMQNPSIKSAINESGISINKGNNPPSLTGTYLADGEVTDASFSVNSLVGMPIYSEIRLYNQTTSGKIDFQETFGELTAWGNGGYITGDNGSFTIWQESVQSGNEAGLDDDVVINVVLLMSGIQQRYGDLTAKGISIITQVETNNSEYNAELLEGLWWIWEADFEQLTTKSVNIRLKNSKPGFLINGTIEKLLENVVL